MKPFEWPQYVMAALLLLFAIYCTVFWFRDNRIAAGQVTLRILVMLAELALFATLLHAGGFW